MSGKELGIDSDKDIPKILKSFWQRLVQIAVQSRLGEKQFTISKGPMKSASSWFNLELVDNREVYLQNKKSIGHHVLSPNTPFNIEFQLRTKDGESMVLEVWTVTLKESLESSPAKAYPTVYERVSVLLKSALCISRITPAYKLSFRQSPDSYIICYLIYTGQPESGVLGVNSTSSIIGQVNTSCAILTLKVSYRTELSLRPHPNFSLSEQILLKSDHFKCDASPKHCRRIERSGDSSETQISDESTEAMRYFTASPSYDFKPRSRTCSESSLSKPASKYDLLDDKTVNVPFAQNFKPDTTGEELLPDFEFSNLLVSTIDTKRDVSKKCGSLLDISEDELNVASLLDRRLQMANVSSNIAIPKTKGMSSIAGRDSLKSISSAKDDSDYVLVSPFVGTSSDSETDLGAFYRDCQTAPQLHSSTLPDSIEDLDKKLKDFEADFNDYEELIKSLNSDSPSESDALD